MARRWTVWSGSVGVAAVVATLIAACSASELTKPADQSLFGGGSSASLLECPSNTTESASALIGIDGGVVSVGGTQVVFPAGALLATSTVQLTVPASKYVEIDVKVNGEEHALFPQPVVVTIDYSRCTRSNILSAPLTVWNIDPSTKALLENMNGLDNKLLKSVTFTTTHFSGYALAD